MTTSVEIINLLQDHGFRRKENVAERYSRMSSMKKQQFMDSLADVYARNRKTILSGCQASEGSFSAYPEQSEARNLRVDEIKQYALFTDQLTINDPLIACHPDLQSKLTIYVREGRDHIEEQEVVRAIELLVDIKELIREGLVKLFPRNFFIDDTVYTYYRQLGNNLLNPEMEEYARKRMGVEQVVVNPDMSMKITGKPADDPTRSIAVTFKDEGQTAWPHPWFYISQNSENVRLDEAAMTISQRFSPQDINEPLDEETFTAWMSDCRERTILSRVEEGFEHITTAEALNSHFVAQSPATWELMRIQYQNKLLRSDQAQISSVVSELNLPFMGQVSAGDLVKLRHNEEAFENFRRAIREFARSVNTLPGTPDFSRQVRELQADKVDPELTKLDVQAKRVLQKLFVDSIIASAPLITSAVTGQFVWLSGLLSAFPLFVASSRDKEQMSKNALFFLWQLKKGR